MLLHIEHRKISVLLFILFFNVSLLTKLSASDHQDVTDDDFYSDIPTVLTISRLEQPKSEAPSSVTVIDKEMIKASGVRELADIFNLVPGFIVSRYTGNKPVVTYHGMGYDFNRQLQVLIDGRSVFIPSFGGIPWESLPVILEDIEKIEITRGPNAASYGSNSFLAAINIITTEAFQNTGVQLSTAHSNSSKDIDDTYFRYSKQAKNYDWGISLKSKKDDGFDFFNEKRPNNDGQHVKKLNLRSNFLITDHSQWSIQFGQSSGKFDKGDGHAGDLFRKEKTINRYQSLTYEQTNLNTATSIKLFHTEHDARDSFNIDYTIPKEVTGLAIDIITPASINFNRFSERTELEAQSTIDWSKKLRFVFGGSIRKDTVDSFFLLGENQKQSVNVKRLFAHSEYKINNDSIINVGGMLEQSDIVDSAFSPRISFIKHIDKQHTLRFAYSQAYRNPILFEQNGRWAFEVHHPLLSSISPLEFYSPNPDLKPEEIRSFEIGLNSALSHNLETDFKLYRYNISDQIELIRGSSKTVFNNSDSDTKTKGLEISLSYKPNHNILIKSGINFLHANGINKNFTDSFPSKNAFIMSQYDINQHHSVSGVYHYLSKMSWVDAVDQLDSTQKLDLRYAYRFTVSGNSTPFILETIGQNLLSDYADYKTSNVRSRSLFIKLSTHF